MHLSVLCATVKRYGCKMDTIETLIFPNEKFRLNFFYANYYAVLSIFLLIYVAFDTFIGEFALVVVIFLWESSKRENKWKHLYESQRAKNHLSDILM